jgi:hypothetical protein
MATAKPIYASASGTAFTITLASLGVNGVRQSTFVNNQSSNLWLDVTISGLITTGAGAAIGDCYILGAGYDGNNYPFGGSANLGASDAAVTFNKSLFQLGSLQYGQPVPGTGLVFLCGVPTGGIAASTAVTFGPIGLSQAFQMGGLTLPVALAVVVVNGQGQAFSSTAGNYAMYYNGTQQSIA